MAVIQFDKALQLVRKQQHESIATLDPRIFVQSIITQGFMETGRKPDFIIHLDSKGIFSMTTRYTKLRSTVANEYGFLNEGSEGKHIYAYMDEFLQTLVFDQSNHRDVAYGTISKNQMRKWLVEQNFNHLKPAYGFEASISGMEQRPMFLLIFPGIQPEEPHTRVSEFKLPE